MELTRTPRTYRWATFDHRQLRDLVHPPSAIETARQSSEPMVVITGPTGVGKSILAAAMTVDHSDARWWCFPEADDVVTREEVREWRQKVVRVPTLVLDNLCVPTLPDDEQEEESDAPAFYDTERHFVDLMESLIHGRAGGGRRTIVTTCLTEHQVEHAYSIAVARFIFGGTRIELDPSYDWKMHPRNVEVEGDLERGELPF